MEMVEVGGRHGWARRQERPQASPEGESSQLTRICEAQDGVVRVWASGERAWRACGFEKKRRAVASSEG